jgi:hypothetical protein
VFDARGQGFLGAAVASGHERATLTPEGVSEEAFMVGVALVLLYFLLALLAAALIMQSDRYAVRRTAAIAGKASRVFALAADPASWAPLGAVSVVETEPNARVVLRLVNGGGAESHATIALAPEGAQTRVDCVVAGRNGLIDKARDFFGFREKTWGPKIEQALAGLAASA